MLVGLGNKNELDIKKYVAALKITAAALAKYSLADALLTLAELPVKEMDAGKRYQLLAQVLENSTYRYNHTKSTKGKKPALKKWMSPCPTSQSVLQPEKAWILVPV